MRNRIGNVCMLLGAVLILAALSLFLWNQREDQQAKMSAEKILSQMTQHIEATVTDRENGGEEPDPYNLNMTEIEIDGYAYVGYLSIPAIELELPVMSEWDYTRLKIAPCRYAGSAKTDDFVIAAHNYTCHFGPIKSLSIGDTVMFTDMDGVLSLYRVAAMEVLNPTDIEEMTAGDYDLTLFTCTYGGQSRMTVRCERVR